MKREEPESYIDQIIDTEPSLEPIPSRRSVFYWWTLSTFLYTAAGGAIVGVRSDLGLAIVTQVYWLQFAFVLVAAFVALLNTVYYSRPRPFLNQKLLWFAVAALLMWLGFILNVPTKGDVATYYKFPPDLGLRCSRNILLFGFLPGLFLIVQVRKSFPTQTKVTGCFVILLGALVGTLANHFFCPTEQVFHTLIFHFGPILATGALGYFFFSRWLRW